jgi:hypothetical protein
VRSDNALSRALDLAATPGLSAQLRRSPLPEGVLEVIKIAAGCEETLDGSVATCKRSRQFIKSAAELYVLQILLHSGADCHRTLGVRRDAPREEARMHLKWLLMWLHPDRSGIEWQTAYAPRVLAAWRAIDRGVATTDAGAQGEFAAPMIGLPQRPLRKRIPIPPRQTPPAARWLAVAAALSAMFALISLAHWDEWGTTQAESLIVNLSMGAEPANERILAPNIRRSRGAKAAR